MVMSESRVLENNREIDPNIPWVRHASRWSRTPVTVHKATQASVFQSDHSALSCPQLHSKRSAPHNRDAHKMLRALSLRITVFTFCWAGLSGWLSACRLKLDRNCWFHN